MPVFIHDMLKGEGRMDGAKQGPGVLSAAVAALCS